MALSIDAYSDADNETTSLNTLTWSHTCAVTADLIVVQIPESRGVTIVSVTYNAAALTLATSVTSGNSRAYIYYKASPSTGANNVVVTYSASNAYYRAGAISFIGADTSDPIGVTNTETGTSYDKDISITTEQSGSFLVDCMGCLGGTHVAGTGQTAIVNGDNRTSSYKATANAGAYTTEWNQTPDTDNSVYSLVIAEIRRDANPSTEFTITISETITTTEILAKPVNYNKSFSETFSITEALEACKAVLIDVSETIGLTETLTKASAYAKSFTETFSITEALTASQKYLLSIVESISITETLTKLTSYAKSISDTLKITDALRFVEKYWTELTKHTSSYTGTTKHSSSWTNQDKN